MSEAELSRRELDKKDKEVKDKAQRVESLEVRPPIFSNNSELKEHENFVPKLFA